MRRLSAEQCGQHRAVATIDAHVHLWDLAAHPQAWTEQFSPLRRSFVPPDLDKELRDHGVDAAVVVQAGDTVGETLDLLALAAAAPSLAGVVGWVDPASPQMGDALAALRDAPGGKLIGIRHQVEIDPDRRYLARAAVRGGLATLAEAGLTYDLVVSPAQLPLAAETAAVVPGLRFVLDHAGNPPIAAGNLSNWRTDLARIAALGNVAAGGPCSTGQAGRCWGSARNAASPWSRLRPITRDCLPGTGRRRTPTSTTTNPDATSWPRPGRWPASASDTAFTCPPLPCSFRCGTRRSPRWRPECGLPARCDLPSGDWPSPYRRQPGPNLRQCRTASRFRERSRTAPTWTTWPGPAQCCHARRWAATSAGAWAEQPGRRCARQAARRRVRPSGRRGHRQR